MIKFVLNNQDIETDVPAGMTVLDFVRYRKNLKGTKIGCREGDCGACVVLVGELGSGSVNYLSMTSCLMPIANARGKHLVTIEGINKTDGDLTAVQQAMVDQSGTQCGFCTVGFVMSLTGFCIDETEKCGAQAIASIDGNICRCTGYKSIERAAESLAHILSETEGKSRLEVAVEKGIVPNYFSRIRERLENIKTEDAKLETRSSKPFFVGGGTDLYVQRHDEMIDAPAENLFDDASLRLIAESGDFIEIGGSATVTDLLASNVMKSAFPHLDKHLKLVSSTPIRNMATLAGNFVNASPIGDMTAWFLALDAAVAFNNGREIRLRELYLGYKTLAKNDDEFIKTIRFRKNFSHFNFEKVSKRTFLDISSVNTAISLHMENDSIAEAHVSAGGVAPVPLYLNRTSKFLGGRKISDETIARAIDILQSEISPISDVRGSSEYKRLLLGQLFRAHFAEMFGFAPDA